MFLSKGCAIPASLPLYVRKFNGLRVAKKVTTVPTARIMPSTTGPLHLLSARFEDGVELGAILRHFPGALEPGRDDEPFAGSEFPTLARGIFEDDSTAGKATELRFGISDAPLAHRARPHAAMKLLAHIAEVVADVLQWIASQQAIRGLG